MTNSLRTACAALLCALALAACGGGGNNVAASAPPPATTPPPADPAPPAADPLRVRTTEGEVQGKAGDGALAFLGIPYAQPPVGDLRWAPPQPPAVHAQLLQAVDYGHACAQAPIPGVAPSPSEDCLYLNVWKPAGSDANAKLPVLFYIHGGAFVLGSGAGDYSPLARRGVIVVSLNYRLGALGYLANTALRQANGDGSLGNFAVMDMLAALQWVQGNIAAFGGDPKQVTIWGTSAGATQSFSLLQSPLARGLFQRAVMQSGGGGAYSNLTPETALATGDAAVVQLGCAGAGDATATVACLRAQPVSALLALGASKWRPTVDARVLTQIPARAFESGNFNQVPVMIGGVYDEGTLFVDPGLSAAYYPLYLRGLAPAGYDTTAIEAAYPQANYAVPAQGFARAMGDAMYACGNSARRDALSAWVPVYGWEFTDPALSFPPSPGAFYYGSAHGMDSYYFTGTVDDLPTYPYFDAGVIGPGSPEIAQRRLLGDQMMGYLLNFVRSGNPNAAPNGQALAVAWPRYAVAQRDTIDFTLPQIRTASNFDQVHHCDTLWSPAVFPSIY